MIKQPMLVQKVHRLSFYNLSPNVDEVHSGQFFHLNDDGEWDYADGTRKAYPTTNDRFRGEGFGLQGERLEGRDNVSGTGKISCLMGGYEISSDQYDDTKTYTHGAPLGITGEGQVTLFDEGEMDPLYIVGYVTQPPEEQGDYLTFHGV